MILVALAFWLGGFTMFALAFVSSSGWKVAAIVVGVWSIFKGVFDLVAAFHYRGLKHEFA